MIKHILTCLRYLVSVIKLKPSARGFKVRICVSRCKHVSLQSTGSYGESAMARMLAESWGPTRALSSRGSKLWASVWYMEPQESACSREHRPWAGEEVARDRSLRMGSDGHVH